MYYNQYRPRLQCQTLTKQGKRPCKGKGILCKNGKNDIFITFNYIGLFCFKFLYFFKCIIIQIIYRKIKKKFVELVLNINLK